MTDIFLKILSMSVMASYCVLLICVVRVPLKCAPKVFSYLLWLIVAVRLVCPISLTSSFSLVGGEIRSFTDHIAAGDLTVDYVISASELSSQDIAQESSLWEGHVSGLKLSQAALSVASCVWLAGVFLLLGYWVFTYIKMQCRVKKKAVYAYSYQQIGVYEVAGLDTPFVLGLKKTAIYMPKGLQEQETKQCLAHEYAHIQRKDYLIKQFAFLLACVYWFQPLVWLAFHLMSKDMEMSCDEMALRKADLEDRKAYSNALLHLSSGTHHLSGHPLAFGKKSAASRIKNILRLRKPAIWMIVMCGILVFICAAGLLTDPADLKNMLAENGAEEEDYSADRGSSTEDSADYPGDELEEAENKLKGLIDALASAEMANSDQDREDIYQDPVTVLEEYMNLSGGEAQILKQRIRDEDGLIIGSLTYVQYTFAVPDEEGINQICVYMREKEGKWYIYDSNDMDIADML